ncbi:F-box family protein [Striga asiatica]|uniref:F-box family protein n=1 Tax=Striga asiatica TaxID=4170 RepID=A0A5A7R9C0_STRAF|nr:F-box family protein [Striga asiatica]
MVQLCEQFSINDNRDVLLEILKRLDDDRSLAAAACVCRLWRGLARSDALWEHLCFRQLAPPPEGVRAVVAALGGYRRLYTACVRPVLRTRPQGRTAAARVWSRHEVDLSLSLFCVDYYERVMLTAGRPPPSDSLVLGLCGAVGV